MPKKKDYKKRNKTLEAELVSNREAEIAETREDSSLFFVDKGGDNSARVKALRQEKKDRKKMSGLSKTEDALVRRMVAKLQRSKNTIDSKRKADDKSGEYDLWNKPTSETHGLDSFVAEAYTYKGTKRRKIKKHQSSLNAKKQKAFKTLTQPSGGLSYNPSFDDHQNVLADAVAVEVEWKDKKTVNFPKLEPEMILDQEALLAIENDDEGDSGVNLNALKKVVGKKDRAQRNKEMRVRAKEEALQKYRENKKLLKEIDRAQDISREIVKEERRQNDERIIQNKLLTHTEETTLPSRMLNGKTLEERPVLKVNLTEDLSGSLRTMKPLPTAKVLMGEIESLHRQNKIEVNIYKRQKKKGKKKEINAKKLFTIKELEAMASA